MNRKQRRLALARGKTAAAPPLRDIAAEMADAIRAHQQGQSAQAEVLCKQILARAPGHVACLNLLGLIYQASGRHRLAVRTFGKAIALDDLDPAIHYNIASSHHLLGERTAAAAHFKTAIVLGMDKKKSVEEFVMENPAIVRCIGRIADNMHSPVAGFASMPADEIAALADDLFLRCALELTILRGVTLELLLTQLRTALLRLVSGNAGATDQVSEDVAALFCALAQQCFINEYVFAQTDEETQQAGRIQLLLLEKLSAGEPISPFIIAAAAAYVPLHSLPGAQALLALDWPDYAADLLRVQVREPLEEAKDRPTIPALTGIDDAISMEVMRQYDENPYPRWTINPFAVLAKAAARRAAAAAGGGGEPMAGQDILIAGCGTGRHPIANAQYSPTAQILAIDISRASLAYARRKTREENVQNIDYAQADILKLGAIGRSFDRIEAVGVLHHLADPEAGVGVLLSLLRPGGVLRLGLYSELARRSVVEARRMIAERFYRATGSDIRALRQTIIRDQRWKTLLMNGDFYSMSGCRDLLFNVVEHRFTIPRIAALLEKHRVSFFGFELDPGIVERFQELHPGAEALTDLDEWHTFEQANPQTFRQMYLFSVSKKAVPA